MSRTPDAAPPIPGFEYAEVLGSGGFSDVFRYTELGLGRSVAVKVLLADVDQAAFQAEAKVMAQLGNHPSIVSIYQAGILAGGRAFLVMEYCPPPHLGLRLRGRPLPVSKALEVTIQLAGAVETAHKLGILHRDIKPANILFTEFGRPALTDFGIAEATGRAAAGQGVGMSPPWAPPEQLRIGAPMGVTADVYSLAATLWTGLVGRSPFNVPGGANDTGSMAQRVRNNPVPRTRRADVPESLEGVLRVAMAKQAGDRFGSALELARALQAVQAELHQSVTPIEVRDEPLDLAVQTDHRDIGGTHITGFVAIDPDGNPAATIVPPTSSQVTGGITSPVALDRTPAPPPAYVRPLAEDDTALGTDGRSGSDAGRFVAPAREAVAAVAPAPEPAVETPDPARNRRRVAVGVAATVLVGGIAAAVVFGGGLRGDGTTPDGPVPSDSGPLPEPTIAVVPAPAEVTVAAAKDKTLTVNWVNPDPEAGDQYLYRLDDPDAQVSWQSTEQLSGTVTRRPGRGCVFVAILRADHQMSNDPAHACVGGGS